MSSSGPGGAGASAAPAAPLSPADAADVAVLESTLFRFASCEDDKLEATIARVLPKLLPLFLRPSAAVRDSLSLICSHVNKRLNALPQLRLPAPELLQLYQQHGSDLANPNLNYFITFVLMYIEKAFQRSTAAERAALAHQLLPGLALRTQQHQRTILHTFFRCLSPADYAMEQVPTEEFTARWASLRASADDQRVILEFMLDALLWAPVFVAPAPRMPQMGPTPMPTVAGQAAVAASAAVAEEKQAELVPDGLSPAALAALTLDGTLSSAQLQSLKAAVLHFGAHADVFSEMQLLPLAIAGSCVGNSDVVHAGEAMLKRLKNVDLEDAQLVERLFAMYLGSLDSAAMPVERRRRPAPYAMKVKILERLSRSRVSVSMLQPALRLLMDTLFSATSTPKLKNAGLIYCNFIINNASPAHIHTIAPVLLNALLKFMATIAKPAAAASGGANGGNAMDGSGDDSGSGREQQTSSGILLAQMRGVCYQLIGQLSLKRPELFNQNLKMMSLFFRALQEERVDTVLQDIHDGLSMLRSSFVGVDQSVQTQLQQVLLQMLAASDKRVRLNALQCLNRLFPYQDVLARYLCVCTANDPDLPLRDESARGLVPFIPRNELEAERKRMRQKREQERKEELERKKKEQAAAATAGSAGSEAKEDEAAPPAASAVEEEAEEEAKSPSAMEVSSPEPAAAAASSSSSSSSSGAVRQPHALLLPLEAAKVPYPSFSSLVAFAHAHILAAGADASAGGRFTAAQTAQLSFLKSSVTFDVRTLPRLLDYLYETLKQNAFYAGTVGAAEGDKDGSAAASAGAAPAVAGSPDPSAATGLTDEEIDARVSRYAAQLLAEEESAGVVDSQRSLLLFQALIEHALEQRIHDVQSSGAQHLVRLVSIRPALFAPVYAAKLAWVESQMTSGIQALRSAMAQLLHLIAAHLQPDDALRQLLSSFSAQLSAAEKVVGPSRDDVTHGCVLALGVLAAEAMRRDKKAGVDADSDAAARASAPFPFAQLEAIVLEVARRLDANTFNRTPHITAAAIISLGRMGEVGRLPVPIGGGTATDAAATASALSTPAPAAAAPAKAAAPPAPSTRSAIVSQLLSLVKSSGERKAERVVEESIQTLSLLCTGDRSLSLLNEVMDGFFAAANSKHEELHFAIGQAMVHIAKQHQHPMTTTAPAPATSVSMSLTPQSEPTASASAASSAAPAAASRSGSLSIGPNQDLLCVLLPRLFQLVAHGSSLQRTAATTYLLCVVKFGASLPAVSAFFERIQAAFSVALTDSSQFVQEVAAKGMATLYELSSGASQQKLVDDLLRTFSSGQRRVAADTVVALDEEKGEFATYKELVEVAKDMNKPDLVYQFMDLAAHHSIWSSKLGAAFSLSSMLQANSKLTAQLGSILPKLFRYQYDSNAKISESMRRLWASLVPNPREAISTHFGALMADLLDSMGNRQFRVRQSACLALADLVHGRGEEQLGPHLERLWANTFRLLDDVNEHVRKAATALAGTLSQLSVRLCDTKFSNRVAAQRALAIVLPVLLTQGITSKAKEIQSVSIRSVLAIIRVGGVNLRPHLATLVGTLLESMSNLEPAVFSYLQFHSASMAMSEEQLERARLSMASGGVLAEALSSCLLVVDDESIPSLLSKLGDIIGTGIGLPTLTGAAKFVVSLVNSKSGPAMREYVAPLIQQLFQGLNDQSPTLRKSYADALGYCCKVAKKKRVEKLMHMLIDMYVSDKSTETSRLISGFAVRSIVRQAGDVIRSNFMLELVPVVWLASHDNTPGNADIAKSWSDAFEELVPGMDAAIALYQKECVELIRKLLDSQVYALRHISLLALKHLILAAKLRFAEEMDAVLPQLVKLLPGRLWTGKEVALDALVFLAQECASRMTAAQARTLMDALRGECARNRTDYRREAIRCTGKAALCFPFLMGDEVLQPMRAVLQPILDLTASSTKAEQSGAAPASAASSSGAASSSSSAASGEEKESGPDVLLVTYTYACLADLFPSAQSAVTTLHALRVQGKEGAAAGVDDADWYQSQAAHVDWVVDSLLAGLDKGFVWTIRVAIFSALRRVLECLYGGEEIAPATAGSSDVVSKRAYGPSLVRPDLLGKVAAALLKNTGLGEPKYPLVKARAIEMLQACADKQTVWSALVSPSNLAVCRELNAQLLSMRADTDATVLRLAPAIQAKLAAAIAQ